jgi:hypothetical protein
MKNTYRQLLKKESPILYKNYMKVVEEQFELFAKKQLDYGIGNISTGADMESKEGKSFALQGLWFRMNDKINRWKNLIIKNRKANNESLKDTFQDLGNYSIICQLVNRSLWKE